MMSGFLFCRRWRVLTICFSKMTTSVLARNFPLLSLNIISSHPLCEVTDLDLTLTPMLFEYPIFLSIKACRVRGGKTLRVPDEKLDIGERSATSSGRFTTSWKPDGSQNYSDCWRKQKNEISVWTDHSTSGAIVKTKTNLSLRTLWRNMWERWHSSIHSSSWH